MDFLIIVTSQKDILFYQLTAPEDVLFHQLIVHHNIEVTLESNIDTIHEVGVLIVKDQEVIFQVIHKVEALNVIAQKVLEKIKLRIMIMLELSNSPETLTLLKLSVSPEPTNGYKSKILHHINKVGENIAHVKKVRKHWYDFKKWSDSSKPPDDALE
ncbi:14664_t:CDS:2 [Dentiscutata erythropus]|uniref:14664_t:CDS:1 n=1 Tax=Dentiscutata erythropus TaxID=1348616 RepID=A0A9N8YQE2_9GLOM|nr:14664_t:CDS:2 [Dentiscutata erythropus]